MSPPGELVVCSLEAWDDVWRRNQFVVDNLLRKNPELRVLFVEPPADVLFDLTQARLPSAPRLLQLGYEGRLRALRPLKALPRRLGGATDALLRRQVRWAARRIELRYPVLWVNDLTYAPLIEETGWPSVYDVTDDWLLFDSTSGRERARLQALEDVALTEADEVVVCSPALAASRGQSRPVTLVPNGVDVVRFRQPQPRPADLPAGPTAVYVGSLHDGRLDADLVLELARRLPALTIVLVGPDSLRSETRQALRSRLSVRLLGPRPHETVPAYLQHADVIVVPHRLTPFTDSLDPIKAYECLAVGTPTVATPVAGFRELAGVLTVVSAESFPDAVQAVLSGGSPPAVAGRNGIRTWDDTARAFAEVLRRAAAR